jgi:hypothetical protein
LLSFSHTASAFTLLLGDEQKGWSGTQLSIQVAPEGCPNYSEDRFNAVVDIAIAMWNSVPTSRLTLVRGARISGASEDIELASGTATILCDPNMDSTLGQSIAGYGGPSEFDKNGNIVTGFVVINGSVGGPNWIPTETRLAVIIAHELGHMLGLGHSSDPRSIMSYDNNPLDPRLGQDDMDAISYLYPRNEGEAGQFFGCGSLEKNLNNQSKNNGLPRMLDHDSGRLGKSSFYALVEFIGLLGFCLASVRFGHGNLDWSRRRRVLST